MNFIILGGGCFGTFYARQLLRSKNISFDKIIIVDLKSDCQAFQELGLGDGKIEYVTCDWKEFFLPYFIQKIDDARKGHISTDHYIPPTFAPHILKEAFLDVLKKEIPEVMIGPEPMTKMIVGGLQTPFESVLPSGDLAASFATWTCPATCIEPPLCPVTKGPKDWDMKKQILKKITADHVSIFQCRHFAMGVGTIPVSEITSEYLSFSEKISQKKESRVVMASVSSCHGLLGGVTIINQKL